MRIYTDEKDRLLSIWLSAEENTAALLCHTRRKMGSQITAKS